MKTALVGRRPCGCVVACDVKPFIGAKEDMESRGYLVTECTEREAESVWNNEARNCSHGSTQQQLAAIVKKQAGEIAELRSALRDGLSYIEGWNQPGPQSKQGRECIEVCVKMNSALKGHQ